MSWDLQDTAFGIFVTFSFVYGLGALYQGPKIESYDGANTKTKKSIYDRILEMFRNSNTDYPKQPLTKDDFPREIIRVQQPGERNNSHIENYDLLPISETAFVRFTTFLVKTFKHRGIPPNNKIAYQPNCPIIQEQKPTKEAKIPKNHWYGFRLISNFRSESTIGK